MMLCLKFLLVSSIFNNINSFSFLNTKNVFTSELIKQHSNRELLLTKRDTFLYMSDESAAEVGAEEATTSEAEEKKEEEIKPKVDPEITALKEEILSAEIALTNLKMTLSKLSDDVDHNSENGYLRKCADMDNTRRSRDLSSSNSRQASQASSVQNFLPAYEVLEELKAKHADNEFAQSYSGLTLSSAFKQLDVVDFETKVGESINRSRSKIMSEEYSTEFGKNVVIRAEKPGLELNGFVIRLAECVVSLGSEEDAIKETEAKKLAEEEKAAKKDATEEKKEDVAE